MKAMTPSQVKTFVINSLLLREIPYISGPPGIGKSDLCAQIANEFNLQLLPIYLSQMLPEDLTGLPSLNDNRKKAEYTPFDTFPLVGDPLPPGKDGWLIFLDELSSASEEVFAGIYSLLLGHRIGFKQVHPKALIIGAGNRSTDSAIARPLPDTLITRMLPCEMKVSAKDWIKWAKKPESESHDTVVSFIERYPDMLISTVDPSKRGELESYQNPRSWSKVFKIMHLHEKQSASKNKIKKDAAGIPMQKSSGSTITPAISAMLFSAVGTMGGKAFQEFYDETMQIPYPWEIAQTPSSAKIPSTNNAKAELTSSLAAHFLETTEQSRDSLLTYMNRMEKEYASLFSQIITEKLGSTTSDIRLIKEIKNRLNVTDINMPNTPKTTNEDEEEDEEDNPFFLNHPNTLQELGKTTISKKVWNVTKDPETFS